MRRKPGEKPRVWDEKLPAIGGPVPLGGKTNPDFNLTNSEGEMPSDDSSHIHDWTALVDPRRDIVSPERNPYTELTGRHAWIKDAMAETRKDRDNIDYYFDNDNVGMTRRDIYEKNMGEAMADKQADEQEAAQQGATQQFVQQLQQAGVAGLAKHPTYGTPMLVDAAGNPVPMDSVMPGPNPGPGVGGRVQVDANGKPYDVATGQGTDKPGPIGAMPDTSLGDFFANEGSGDPGSAGAGTEGQDGQNIGGAIETVLMHLQQYDDPRTQQAVKQIQQHLQSFPAQPTETPLHDPGIMGALFALVSAKVLPPQVAMAVASMPYQAALKNKADADKRNAQTHADELTKWKGELSLLDNQLSSAQSADKTDYAAKIEQEKFNTSELNKHNENEANRKLKAEESTKKIEAQDRKATKQQLWNIGYGPGANKVDDATRKNAQELYADLGGMDDSLISDPSQTPYFQQAAELLRKTTAQADLTESKAYVAEQTEQAQIDKKVNDAKLSGLRGDVLRKTLKWYDAKAQADIIYKQGQAANVSDMIRSRKIRDRIALDENSRKQVTDAFKGGMDELKRLSGDTDEMRKNVALWEGELFGNTKSNQTKGGGGIVKELGDLKAKKTKTDADNARIKELETRKEDLVTRISDGKEFIETNGTAYNETAKDVKTMRDALSVKPLGNADDRKVQVGSYTFDLGGSYVFGAKGTTQKDCSGFIKTSMKSGGITDFPGSCKEQLDYLNGPKGKAAGFQNITLAVNSGKAQLEEGDLCYLPGSPPPHGSGYHVKAFAGWDSQGRPTWMEAKSTKKGVGTFVDTLKGKKIIGFYRPPKN